MNNNTNLQYTVKDFAYNCLIYQTLDCLKDEQLLKNKQFLNLVNSLICLYDDYEQLSDNTKSIISEAFQELDKAGLYDRVR